MTRIYVFGNPDLEVDSLPLRILPELKKLLPEIEFQIVDPNDDWPCEALAKEGMVILDTAVGISEVMVFNNLDKFTPPPRVSLHDFDALTNLRYLQKLGKIKSVKVIAIPAETKATLSDIADRVAGEIRRFSLPL
jgi:hypothetical protein